MGYKHGVSAGEQIGNYTRGVERKTRKKDTVRKMRRIGKAQLDNAPKKLPYSGYSD